MNTKKLKVNIKDSIEDIRWNSISINQIVYVKDDHYLDNRMFQFLITQINIIDRFIIGIELQHTRTIKVETFILKEELTSIVKLNHVHINIAAQQYNIVDNTEKEFNVMILNSPKRHYILKGLGFFDSNSTEREVMIGSCSWYNRHIGDVLTVLPFCSNFYRVLNSKYCGFFFINKDDCKVL